MIESSFSCSSSWELEPLQGFPETQFIGFEDYVGSFDRNSSSFSVFNDSSSSSSDHNLGFDELNNLPVSDSFISEILEDSNSTGYEDEWSLLCDFENYTLPVESCSTSIRESPKKSKKTLNYLSNKLWSKMSPEEQLETLHSLSKIVTCHMGIREQIKVIKIIDPSATISPDDTEFALDVSCLNDAKMKRLQDFVQKHGFSLSNSCKKLSSSKNISSEKQSQSNKVLSRRTNSKTKRRQKKPKSCTDEYIRQKRKLELHGQKEIRSGLFVYEKVIKLSSPLEDEDVNILE